MERLTLIKKAEQLACESIRDTSCLSDCQYADYQDASDQEAINELALQFLKDAVDDLEDGFQKPCG